MWIRNPSWQTKQENVQLWGYKYNDFSQNLQSLNQVSDAGEPLIFKTNDLEMVTFNKWNDLILRIRRILKRKKRKKKKKKQQVLQYHLM